MKSFNRFITLSAFLLLTAVAALGQGVTGNLVGTVTSEGTGVPGVTVTATSPVLQGSRTAVSGEAGGYSIPSLPPGDYTVVFELSGMQTVTKRVRINLTQTSRADADLRQQAVSEAITVTASAPAALETTEVSTNYTGEQISELPTLNRTIATAALLAAGVNDGGPNNQIQISGGQSFDNLFLVNGVVVNENLRGQPHALFIEDAIAETTVLSGGSISAEYGRFTGGVVSTITKSGGNEFTGSLRDSLRNDSWKSKTDFPGEADHLDDINSVYEGTFGGRIIRDRLWFFTAGRKEKTQTSAETVEARIPFTQVQDQKRIELKLTGQITPRHSLVASYLDVDTKQTNNLFGNVVDLRSLTNRELPNTLQALHYNGVLTNNLLVEGQYSQMDFAFVGGGANTRDRIEGTLLRENGTSFRAWSPTFCGICRDKERNNKSALAKASYFLSTKALGQHSLVAGWEDFHQLRVEDNYQSGSNYRIWGDFDFDANRNLIFRANPSNGLIAYHPLLEESKGSDFRVQSFFVNDKWDFNSHLNFNVGLRYDKADGENQSKVKTVSDSAYSPRLGATFDLRGDGAHRFSATYSKYASKVDQGPGDATSFGGRYASYYWDYRGPAINPPGTPAGQIVPVAEVIRQVFAWFDSVGGINNTELIDSVSFPGFTSRIGENLTAPSMTEYTIGYGLGIGRGFFRADLVRREWGDFYVLRRDLSTGKVNLPAPSTARVDQGVIETGDYDLERNYTGIQTQGQYRFTDRFSVGGNYTWSKLRGNIEGEQFNNATVLAGCNGGAAVPGTDSGVCAPEYQAFEQNHPVGYLEGDMRHRASLWASYNLPTPFGRFNFSVLERYHSGLPYSAAASIDIRQSATLLPDGVVNPGYITPPSRVWYYFSERGEFRLDDITSTNVAVNYESPSFGRVRFFVQTDIINIFNEQGVEYASTARGPVINQTVAVRRTSTAMKAFNPFTTTPVAGTHYALASTFGTPTNREAYQEPREYRVSFGVRF